MGLDTTPRTDRPQADDAENAPPWFLVLGLVIIVIAFVEVFTLLTGSGY